MAATDPFRVGTTDPTDTAAPIPVLILAAGAARRMRGADKLLEQVEGLPLIRLLAREALACELPVHVALPGPDHPRWRQLDGLPVARIAIHDAADGLSASLRAGIRALPSDAGRVMLLLADLPELRRSHLRQMLEAAAQHPHAQALRGTSADGAPGHPVILSLSLRPQLLALKGDQGAGALLKTLPVISVKLPGTVAITDLDTPEQWTAWRAARDD